VPECSVQITNSKYYSEFRNSVTAEKMKKKEKKKKKDDENMLEKYSFYLKTQNKFTTVLIQFLTVENTVSDSLENS
jgi:hypothetical protein